MKRLSLLVFALSLGVAPLSAEDSGFLSTMSPARRAELGLDQLTPQQEKDLNAAVDAYRAAKESAAVQVAVQQAKADAVTEYKKKEEPSVIARALDIVRKKHEEEKQERITAKILGRFEGWDGRTLFRLDNGQIWQQAAQDIYDMKPSEDVAVVIYKAGSGYWRLRILDDKGAWVTVKRVR